jgi:hypothetical protein
VRKHAPARTGPYINVAYSDAKVTISKQEVTFTGELVKRDWRYLRRSRRVGSTDHCSMTPA